MPKYYCDYCDIFLTHDSPSVRKAHNTGWKHRAQVRSYYAQFENVETQAMIDGIMGQPPGGLPFPQLPPGMPMPRFGPGGVPFPPFPPPGAGGMHPPPGMPFPPGMMPPPGISVPPGMPFGGTQSAEAVGGSAEAPDVVQKPSGALPDPHS